MVNGLHSSLLNTTAKWPRYSLSYLLILSLTNPLRNPLTIHLSGKLRKLYYTVTFNGVLQSQSTAIPPLLSQFILPPPLATYNLPDVVERSFPLEGYKSRSTAQFAAMAVVLRMAWENANPGKQITASRHFRLLDQ